MDNLNKLIAADPNFNQSLTKTSTTELLSQKLLNFNNQISLNNPYRLTDKFERPNDLLACD